MTEGGDTTHHQPKIDKDGVKTWNLVQKQINVTFS